MTVPERSAPPARRRQQVADALLAGGVGVLVAATSLWLAPGSAPTARVVRPAPVPRTAFAAPSAHPAIGPPVSVPSSAPATAATARADARGPTLAAAARPKVVIRPAPREAGLVGARAAAPENLPDATATAASPVAAPETVAPVEAVERSAPTPPPAAPAVGGGVLELTHPLGEGLIEVSVDEHRVALVRITAPPQGERTTAATFVVTPGPHRVLLRVLSIERRVNLEFGWDDEWAPGEVRTRRLALTADGDAWRIQDSETSPPAAAR